MIYRVKYDRQNYMVFDISADEIEYGLGDIFLLYDSASSWSEFWKPLNGRFLDDSDSQQLVKVPDVSTWFINELVLNDDAFSKLSVHLSKCGEFLPVAVEGIPYWILHVNKFIDMHAIDESKSERFLDAANCINLVSLTFNESEISDLLLFRTEYTGYKNLYCTEKFKSLIESSGLKGLLFSTDLACIEDS